jgi:hypothetical protein
MSIISSKLAVLTEGLMEIAMDLRKEYEERHNAHFAEPTTTVESCIRRLKHVVFLLEHELNDPCSR